MPTTTDKPAFPSQKVAAKMVGFLYVFTMATAVFSEMFVRGKLIVARDAAQTAANIRDAELLFRMGMLSDMFTLLGVLVLIWALHVVLQPVNRHLAGLAAALRMVENVVLMVGLVHALSVLRVLTSDAAYFKNFSPEQLEVIARLSLAAQVFGTQIAFILLGFGSSVFAWLWLKSGYIPKAISILGIIGSLLMAVVGLLGLVFPNILTRLGLMCMMPLGVFEGGLGIWLLVKGIRLGNTPV